MGEFTEASSALLDGYLTDKQAAAQRGVSPRTQRAERQRGSGPPYVKDGKRVLYEIRSFRVWLKSLERQPGRAGHKAA
jgi:hypothetical protein